MVPLPFNLCSNRNEGESSSPPTRPQQHDVSTHSRSNSFEGGISMEALHPKVKQYGQDMAKRRRASDSAYVNKSAGEWVRTTQGRAAMEQYEADSKMVKDRQIRSFESRRNFCGVNLCSHSINLPPQSPSNGSDGYKQRARRSIFDAELESYDRELLSSLDLKTSGDSKILEREEKIEHSLESVRRRLEADERAFHEKVAREFESGVHHHLRNFDRDLDQLRSCLLNLHRDVVECERGPTSEMATNLIVLAGHQAYELDIILLTKYRFLQRINEIRKGPIRGRNEKAIIQAFEYAEVRALREITLDGLKHSCEPHSDPLHPFARCPACHKHALELFEPRNDEIHQNVLKRGLYQFGKTPDSTEKELNVEYYFIAFACKIVKERYEWQQNGNSHIRKDVRDRMFLLFDDFYKHCVKQKPSTCQETHEIYLKLRKYWKSVRHDDIENKLQELERQNQTNSQQNEAPPPTPPHQSDLGPPPSPLITPRSQSLPHVMTARNPLVASSASPTIDSPNSGESQESSRRLPGFVSRTRSSRSAPANPRREDPTTTRIDSLSAENSDPEPRRQPHSPPYSPSSPLSNPILDLQPIPPSSSRPQTAPASSHEPAGIVPVPVPGRFNRFRNRLYSAPTLDRPHRPLSSPLDVAALRHGLASDSGRPSSNRGRLRKLFNVLPPIQTANPSPSGSPSRSPNDLNDSGVGTGMFPDENGHFPPLPPRLRTPSLGGPLGSQDNHGESSDSGHSVHSVDSVGEVRGRDAGRRLSTTSARHHSAVAYSPGRRDARRSVSVHRI